MHIRNNSDLGKLFRINLNWIPIYLGISTQLFEYQHEITYLNNGFTHLHQFLLQMNTKLIFKNVYVPLMEREHNCCLMIATRDCAAHLSGNQKRHVNNWRLYFRVHKLSDTIDPIGTQVLPKYLTFPSDIDTPIRTSKLKCPRQQPPKCKDSFQLWVKSLRTNGFTARYFDHCARGLWARRNLNPSDQHISITPSRRWFESRAT
jgi:hypothetical protein